LAKRGLSSQHALACIAGATLLFLAGCASGPRSGSGIERDGADANPPSGLSQVPDAEPRVEAIRGSGGTSKPYVVLGKSYVPIVDDRPFRESGLASWYGRKFHSQSTASGGLGDQQSWVDSFSQSVSVSEVDGAISACAVSGSHDVTTQNWDTRPTVFQCTGEIPRHVIVRSYAHTHEHAEAAPGPGCGVVWSGSSSTDGYSDVTESNDSAWPVGHRTYATSHPGGGASPPALTARQFSPYWS